MSLVNRPVLVMRWSVWSMWSVTDTNNVGNNGWPEREIYARLNVHFIVGRFGKAAEPEPTLCDLTVV